MRRRFRGVLFVGVVVAAIATWAGPAAAHAGLVAASPSAASGLPQAPGAVVLRFSEPLNRSLSHVEVVGSDGRQGTVGQTEAVVGDSRAMQRKLGLLRPRQYTVNWTSVSTLDGHTLRGSYVFGIGGAGGTAEHVGATPVASEGWLGLLGRLGELVGLSL